jgi:hypothetical protein
MVAFTGAKIVSADGRTEYGEGSTPKKRRRKLPVLTQWDLFWVGLSRVWMRWRDALIFSQPIGGSLATGTFSQILGPPIETERFSPRLGSRARA